jgi:hypothetical protein
MKANNDLIFQQKDLMVFKNGHNITKFNQNYYTLE